MGHVWRSDQRTDASTTVHDARLLRLLAARLLPCPTAPPEPPSLRRIQTRARARLAVARTRRRVPPGR